VRPEVLLALATAAWLLVVVAAASRLAAANPLLWYRVVIWVATVLYLVAVRIIIARWRRGRPRI